jgi:RND family efflux transporter MFP subunit
VKPSACLLVAFVIGTTAACRRSATSDTQADPAVPVVAERVELGSMRGTISATGVVTTLPGATHAVVAPQAAQIAEITRDVGAEVKSGEVLVRFEFPSLKAESAVAAATIRAAELRLKQAQLAQTRVRSLLERGAASQREMESADQEAAIAEGELTAANAAMNATQARGQNTIVRAPFDGVVTERRHQPGDVVQASDADPILVLINPRDVQVTATVGVDDLARFATGATAHAIAERTAVTQLLRVASKPAPDPGAKTAAVVLRFDSPTELAPGTQVGIEIDAEQRTNVPVVPAIAVLIDGVTQYVMIAAGNEAQRRAVVTGLVDAEKVEIRSGVKVGELVITQGHTSLKDGAAITMTAP